MVKADDLVILLEVARAGTLNGAASTLGMNHTTVARRIHQLERDLGSPVMSSSTKGTYLTELGRSLLSSAEQIEHSLNEARSRARGSEEGLVGHVRVSGPEAFSTYFVAPAVAALHAENPGLTVEVTTATRPLLQGSAADVEIGLSRSSARTTGVLTLSDYTLGLYASPDYLRRRGTPKRASDLGEHSLVYYIEGLVRVEDLDVLPRHSVSIGSTSVLFQLEATRHGAGLGLLPAFVARRVPQLVPVLPTEVRPLITFVAAVAPNHLRRPAARAVLQAIRREVTTRRHELLPEPPGPAPEKA